MRPENQLRLRKITRVSTALRWVCTGVIAALSVELFVVTIMLVLGRGGDVSFHRLSFHVTDLPVLRRLQLLGMVGSSSFFLIACIDHLRRLFGNYSRGEIFTGDSARHIRRMGIFYLVWSCVNVVSVPWAVLAALAMNPPDVYRVDVNFGAIAVGLCVIVISWFMDMAVDLREENELTI